jgi:hypothetical protein
MGAVLGMILFLLSGFVLLRVVNRFKEEWRTAEVVRGPAVSSQTLNFPVAGPLGLYLEGPRYRTWSRQLHYSLVDTSSGLPVPIESVLSGAGVNSLRIARVQRGRLVLPRPGPYALQVTGLAPSDASEYAVVFMHPFTGKLLRFIFTCVFAGMVLVGSLVLAILALVL